MSNRFSIPSTFFSSEEKSVNNPNFHPVKIRIMSSGVNWNGSDFVIDSLEMAKDTVSYAPILANIVKRDDGELDANGHDIDFEMKIDYMGNISFKETYIEKPVGVFLANSCEKKYDEENNVYFLEAYGYIWKQYSDMYDILKRDEMKDVSVEIEVQDGSYRDDGIYEIRGFNVLGCTILGNGVLPAIDNSRVEFNFSMTKDEEYENNLRQLDILLQNFCKKGGEELNNEEVKEFEEVEDVEEEDVCPNCGKPQDECECEEVEEEKEFAEEVEEENVCPNCGKPQDECECEEVEEEENAKKKKKKCSETEEVVEEEIIEEVVEGIIVNNKIYSQEELDIAIENVRAEYSQLMEELETLRQFKEEYDRQLRLQKLEDEMNSLLINFNVEEKLVEELKEKVIKGDITLEKFELELFRNNSPMRKEFKKEEKQTKLPIIDNEEKLSNVDKFFAKYGINKK